MASTYSPRLEEQNSKPLRSASGSDPAARGSLENGAEAATNAYQQFREQIPVAYPSSKRHGIAAAQSSGLVNKQANLLSAGASSTQATNQVNAPHQFGLQAFQSNQSHRTNNANHLLSDGIAHRLSSQNDRYPSPEDNARNVQSTRQYGATTLTSYAGPGASLLHENFSAGAGQGNGSLTPDLDPYAPSIVQDLLTGGNEWRNIQDIIKLTLKAVCDVVRTQGLAIRELERVLPTKCNKSELNAGLSLKANVSDVSRTVADVAASIDTKLSTEDVQHLLDEKVSKTDMQYLLSNKVSVDELSRVLENKSNAHEVSASLQSLDAKVEDIYSELMKKVQNCAVQKDFNYLSSVLETKANLEEVNESLKLKANKTSVADALQRKANRADIEPILEQKADMNDLENIISILEAKVEIGQFEELSRQVAEGTQKVDRVEFHRLADQVASKANRDEVDQAFTALQQGKGDQEKRLVTLETEFDSTVREIQRDVEDVKSQVVSSLSKKADYALLERLRETTLKKVDQEYMHSQLVKLKQDTATQIELAINELKYQRRAQDFAAMEDLAKKATSDSQKACDEMQMFKEQLRTLQEERKRDVEETAEFINQLITQSKLDHQKETNRVFDELEEVRRDVSLRVNSAELLETRQNLTGQLDTKVDLTEVQNALNECQTDIVRQLDTFKETIQGEIRNAQQETFKAIDCKADCLDMQQQLDQKVDIKNVEENCAERSQVEQIEQTLNSLVDQIDMKCDLQRFEDFEAEQTREVNSCKDIMTKKSNIKDVCALLDMKSNIEDVNKAFLEMHEEVEQKVYRTDLDTALQSQQNLNEVLCQENCSARWVWRSGQLAANGYAVPWELQSVNTCPENFLWDEDKSVILTIAPGLYEITLGFFCAKKPTVQVLVNGETILTAVNSASFVIHHSSGKLANSGRQTQGPLTGLTLIDFIALPARARVTISYAGANGKGGTAAQNGQVEGFFGLRKL